MFIVKGTKGKGIVSVATQTAASALVTANGIRSNSFSVIVLDVDGHEISIDQLNALASDEVSSAATLAVAAPA